MSKCDLSIELDQDQATFRGGDTITGKVTALVNKARTCRDLEVRLVCKTFGRGNRTSETIASQSLFSGEWESGQRHEHAFQFTFPKGPISYHGDYLNVVWVIETQADIPYAETQAEREVNLEAGPEGYVHDMQLPETASSYLFGMVIVSPLFFMLAAAVTSVQDAIKGDYFDVVFFLGWDLIYGLFLLYLFREFRRFFARRVLGEVQCAQDHSVYFPGDPVPVRVAFTPRRGFRIRHVSATLKCREVVVRGSGTHRKRHIKQIFEEQLILTAPPDFRVGYQVEYTGELSIPKTAPPSFKMDDNALLWSIDVHIDIARWFDWEAYQPLIVGVRPSPATGSVGVISTVG